MGCDLQLPAQFRARSYETKRGRGLRAVGKDFPHVVSGGRCEIRVPRDAQIWRYVALSNCHYSFNFCFHKVCEYVRLRLV